MKKQEFHTNLPLTVPVGKTVVKVTETYPESTNIIGDICYLEGTTVMPEYGVYACLVRLSDGHISLISLESIKAVNYPETLQ